MSHSAEQFEAWMDLAIAEAEAAPAHGDVPIGAVLVDPAGVVVAADHNRREQRADATAHAEMLVLGAIDTPDWRLNDYTLVVTLEPCPMCAGAVQQSRIGYLVYGAADMKAGACWSLYNIPQDARLNHRVEMTAGIRAERCSELLTGFFAERR